MSENDSHELIVKTLNEFSEKHLKIIETLLNRRNMNEFDEKSTELLVELAPSARLNTELLIGQEDAFRSIGKALKLK